MKSADQPVFPLTVTYADGQRTTVDDIADAECNLEWLDTDDLKEPVTVLDKLGRRVRLKVEALAVKRLELMNSPAVSSRTSSGRAR